MFIFSPSVAEKQPRVLKIVFVTGKMTNVMEYITLFDFAAYTTSPCVICEVCTGKFVQKENLFK